MADWASFLNNTAQGLIGQRAAELSTPSKPVALNQATGATYLEGQPDKSAKPQLFGMPSAVVIAGGVLLALTAGYLLLRK